MFFSRSQHRNTVDARIDTIAIFYSLREIRRLNQIDRNAPQSTHARFTPPITESNDNCMMSGRESARAQLAGVLLMVARRNYGGHDNADNFLISLRAIADYLGLSTNKICRELETLDRQAAISIGKTNKIVLVDLMALREIAAEPAKLPVARTR